jgi:uncharacterized protein
MDTETLERVLRQVLQLSKGPVVISWTGGEPLTRGHGFFSKIESVQRELGAANFTNILQSNLILLDDWFVQFLARNNFQVRTSLDLPREYHDQLRREGDFERSVKSVELLRSAGVFVNVNTVVTEKNIGRPDEIYASLKQLKIKSFSVSRLVQQGNAVAHPELHVYDNEAFGRFLVRLFDLWTSDTEPLIERITPLDKLLRACQTGGRDENSKCFHCQSQMFAIGPTGDVFPSCNKFFALPDTCLGNVHFKDLQDIVASNERKQFLASTGDVSGRVCSKCEYVDLCEGGCYYVAHTARIRGEDMHTRERFCKGYYLVFKRILEHLNGGGKCPVS